MFMFSNIIYIISKPKFQMDAQIDRFINKTVGSRILEM